MSRSYFDPRWYYDVGMETVLRVTARTRLREPLTWALPSDVRARIQVRWPNRYRWPPTSKWGDQLREALSRWVPVKPVDLEQPHRASIQTEFLVDGRTVPVAFNISDYPDLLEPQSVRDNLVTFKLQFGQHGYGDDSVLPGGYLPGSSLLYPLLNQLRRLQRKTPRYEVYGRFGQDAGTGIRAAALTAMRETPAFRFSGGDGLIRYSRYLREVARSRVCLDLPGKGPLCFRLVEYLAIGSCVVALPHGIRLPGALEEGVHCATGSDPASLVAKSTELLHDETARASMEGAARSYFDRYLHRDQLGAYYLHMVSARCGAQF